MMEDEKDTQSEDGKDNKILINDNGMNKKIK